MISQRSGIPDFGPGYFKYCMKNVNNTSIKRTFRIIEGIVSLLLVFLVAEGVLLWQVCKQGTVSTQGLVSQGLPSLQCLSSIQANMALYRLRSYELMFVQEQERPAKIKQADELDRSNRVLLVKLGALYPSGGGTRSGPSRRAGAQKLCARRKPGAQPSGQGFSGRHASA